MITSSQFAACIVTSLSPRISRKSRAGEEIGIQYQQECARAWIDAGAKLVSLNGLDEIDALSADFPDVTFVESSTAFKVVPNKPMPSIGEMLRVGRSLCGDGTYGVVNSDILFRGGRKQLQEVARRTRGGFLYGQRCEMARGDIISGLPYLYGFDFFLLDHSLDFAATMDDFAIGAPWWDYALLSIMLSGTAPGVMLSSPILSHLTHDQAWNKGSWIAGLQKTIRLLQFNDTRRFRTPLGSMWEFFVRYVDQDLMPGHRAGEFIGEFGPIFGVGLVDFIEKNTFGQVCFESSIGDEIVFAERSTLVLNNARLQERGGTSL